MPPERYFRGQSRSAEQLRFNEGEPLAAELCHYTAQSNTLLLARYHLPATVPIKPRRVMAQASIPEDTLKQAIKEALTETFAEERDLFREVVVEALEDFALAEAIEEGQQTEKVSRERILDTLEGGRTRKQLSTKASTAT